MTSEAKPRTPDKPRRPRPPRSVSWVEHPCAALHNYGAVRLTVGKDTGLYLVRQIEADFGESAWEVEKIDADLNTVETYHVLLAGRESSCDCRGCTQHGHCKHLDGLKKLDERGQLPRLLRQKAVACNRCQRLVDAPGLCAECQAEDDYHTACDQAVEMEAAGLETFPSLTAEEI